MASIGSNTGSCSANGPTRCGWDAPKTWNQVRLVRRGEQVAVYLNGDPQPIFSGKVSVTRPADSRDVFVGGRSDNFANFEGRLAEVAICAG
jgi:hypothetical protein